jgi:hypothetical protein
MHREGKLRNIRRNPPRLIAHGLGTKHRYGVFIAEGESGVGHEAFAIHPGSFGGYRLH